VELMLTAEGATVLEEALDECLTELRTQIANTDAFDIQQRLKHKEVLLQKILQQIATQGLSHII
jgi:hypothetical protein